MGVSKERGKKNMAKNEEMNPGSFFAPKMNLDSFLSLLTDFSEGKVKFERISSWIGRLLAYKWME